MPPVNNPQDPEQNTELEALAQIGLEANETNKGVEANTEASAVKLDEIEKNTEAQIVQSQQNTDRLEQPLQTIAKNTEKPEVQRVKLEEREDADDEEFNENEAGKALWSMLRGPKGKTPQKGIDYFTDQEIADFFNKVTPKKGEDYFTSEEISLFKKQVTPVKGKDYRDGEDGEDGEDGRNPLTVSTKPPSNPLVGDLWYQP